MKSVLSIQSAVTIGAVGNTMASLVMAAAGHHLCRVDTIQLAAHPGYGFRAGGSIDDQAFADMLDGIERLNPDFAALMTGYIGSPGQIDPLAALISRFRTARGEITATPPPVIIDPAIGDNGRLYIDPAIANGISTHLLPLADIITPNQFELGWLSGSEISNRDDAVDAARKVLSLHHGMQAVVLTGLVDQQQVCDAVITRGEKEFFENPGMSRGFPGGGDLFTAILVAGLVDGMPRDAAVKRASQTCNAILNESHLAGSAEIQIAAVTGMINPGG